MSKDELWIIPSKTFYEKATQAKGSRDIEYIRLNIGPEGSESYEGLRLYRDNFNQLATGATQKVKRDIERASRRIVEEHLKQPQAEIEVLRILSNSKSPLSTKEIVQLIKEKLEKTFTKADLETLTRGSVRWEATTRAS